MYNACKRREGGMAISMKAIYTDGILKLLEPLPLPENQTVSVEITPLGTVPEVLPSDFASLYGIWQTISTDLDAALAAARQTTNAKLQRIIHDTN
jgi:predicted DNA-binding antitoxin AbrB/MazE fold protein